MLFADAWASHLAQGSLSVNGSTSAHISQPIPSSISAHENWNGGCPLRTSEAGYLSMGAAGFERLPKSPPVEDESVLLPSVFSSGSVRGSLLSTKSVLISTF
jgi:hypothetical protein